MTVSENENSFAFRTLPRVEVNQIIYDTIENFVLSKSIYNLFYIGISDNFHEYLQSLQQNGFDDIDQDLQSNGIFFENLKNETNSKGIINAFTYFLCVLMIFR